MIENKIDLKKYLNIEKKFYINNKKDYIKKKLSNNEKYYIWKFQKHLRLAEYYYNIGGIFNKLLFCYHINKKNYLGNKLGIFASINTIEEGLIIYHSGAIVISGLSKCGKNLRLHGNNCIGNKGIDGVAPIIGDNCDMGFGSVIIGDIKLGNNIKIGANAVVNKNFNEGVLVGIPAKRIK